MAIAFDAASEDKTSSTTNLTYAHSCTGTDRFLYVAVTSILKASPSFSGFTYNGVAMTSLHEDVLVNSSVNWYHHAYYIPNPSSGSNNVSITMNSGGTIRSGCTSYTGVHQSTPINVSNTNNGSSGSPASINSTSTADGWWVMSASNNDAGMSGGSVTDTIRAEYGGLCDIADSGNSETAGNTTTTMTYAGSRDWGAIHALFIPVAVAPTFTPRVMFYS